MAVAQQKRVSTKRAAGAVILALASAVILQGLLAHAPAAAFISTTANSWVWLNPLPQGASLYALSCPTASECLAADAFGGVLETADSGSTWTSVNPWLTTGISARTLAGLDCPTPSECVAVASNLALASADGGRSWAEHFISVQDSLFSVSCATSTSCTAVGQYGAIVTTSDAGTTWTSRTSNTGNDLDAVSCVAPATCVAVGAAGTVLNSSDGGASWTVRISNAGSFPLNGVSCPTAAHCVASGGNQTVIVSEDGGGLWMKEAAAGSVNGRISCSNASDCVMVANSGGSAAFTSTDGGVMWLPTSGGGFNGVSCPAATTTCVIVGDNGAIAGSSNGGSTWTAISSQIVDGGRAVTCVQGGCVDVGYAGVATSADGVTWTDRTSMSLNAVSCWSIGFCVAVRGGGLIVTSMDGGASWTPSISGAPTNRLNGVACSSPTACVAVGASGTIVTTADAGLTWQPATSGTANDLNGIACGSPTDCIAVGAAGTVLSSTDGGGHWATQGIGTSQDLLGVSCPTSTFCMAVGGRYAFTSFDQFASSTTQFTPFDLTAVSCPVALACAAVGTYVAAKTYDGGASWSAASIGVNQLTGVSCPSTCWAVGFPNAILADNSRFTSITQVSPAPPAGGRQQASQSMPTPLSGRGAASQTSPQAPPLTAATGPSPSPRVATTVKTETSPTEPSSAGGGPQENNPLSELIARLFRLFANLLG